MTSKWPIIIALFVGNSPNEWTRIYPFITGQSTNVSPMKSFHRSTNALIWIMRWISEITRCGCIASGLIIERMAQYWSQPEQFYQRDTGAHFDKDCTGQKWEPLLFLITWGSIRIIIYEGLLKCLVFFSNYKWMDKYSQLPLLPTPSGPQFGVRDKESP